MTFHNDGAEFFRDSEFHVWSMSSILTSGDVSWFPKDIKIHLCCFIVPPKVHDVKFPLVIIPHESMKDNKVTWPQQSNGALIGFDCGSGQSWRPQACWSDPGVVHVMRC